MPVRKLEAVRPNKTKLPAARRGQSPAGGGPVERVVGRNFRDLLSVQLMFMCHKALAGRLFDLVLDQRSRRIALDNASDPAR